MKKFLILASYLPLLGVAPAIAQDALPPATSPNTTFQAPETFNDRDLRSGKPQAAVESQFLGEALPPTANFGQPVSPMSREMTLNENSGELRAHPQEQIQIGYWGRVLDSKLTRDGQPLEKPQFQTAMLSLDADLASIDLPPDGKRMAVLTITARRHQGLVKALKDAKTDEEKTEAEAALRENYQEHYAVETWWRQQRLTALEEQLAKLKAQVQTRTEAEEKYVDAAMTIAKLHVDGVSITPPVPAAPGGNALNQVFARETSQLPDYAQPGAPRSYNGSPRAPSTFGQAPIDPANTPPVLKLPSSSFE